ncbi:uncharacterized protein [Choristoneura fumiferana]|uniref:uncharacterized protein n=1 Tax=Choristoneura fumiferana TaxID=7141 RepID=UPI003D15AE41
MDSQKEKESSERRPLNIKPPGEFSFEAADWKKWRSRFTRYMLLSGNEKGTDDEKLNVLIYCMGEKAEDVIKRFPRKLNYEETLKSFEEVFTPKKNIVYERFKFNSRKQREDENIDSFITDLFGLAETCEYDTLKEGLIRDRLIVGMRDAEASERLLLNEKLDLKEAIRMAKQAEIQKEDNKLLREEGQIHRIKSKQESFKKNDKCWFCGYERHSRDKCPAVNIKCKSCGRTGHYAKMCRSKSLKRLEEEEEEVVFKEQT